MKALPRIRVGDGTGKRRRIVIIRPTLKKLSAQLRVIGRTLRALTKRLEDESDQVKLNQRIDYWKAQRRKILAYIATVQKPVTRA